MEQQAVYGKEVVSSKEEKYYEITLRIEPMGAVRTTSKGKFTDSAKKYHSWMKSVQWMWVDAVRKLGLPATYTLPCIVSHVEFGIAITVPKAMKGKALVDRLSLIGKPHKKKPDLDNMYKAVVDAICYSGGDAICHSGGDSHIHQIGGMRKIYAPAGQSYIKICFKED